MAVLPLAGNAVAQTGGSPPAAPKQPGYSSQPGAPSSGAIRPVQKPQNISLWRASKLVGENVRDAENKNIGKIEDLMLDSNGRVSFAVMSFGGFLGVGDKLFAVPWTAMRFEHKGNDVTAVHLDVSKDTLEKAPSFARDKWPDSADPQWSEQSKHYWGDRSAARPRTSSDQPSDATITSKVKTKLAAEKASTLVKVDVDTKQGTVHLNGTVDSARTKERAGELARQVDGVKSVVNNLKVQGG
jgi:hypothetical protein